jgi:predicted transposase YbfD/YdcC
MKSIMIIADLESKRQIALARGMVLAKALGAQVEVVGFCYE